jgi:hypothetical protein
MIADVVDTDIAAVDTAAVPPIVSAVGSSSQSRCSSMEDFGLPKATLEAIEQAEREQDEREKRAFTSDEIKEITDSANDHSSEKAMLTWCAAHPDRPITARTVASYKAHFEQHKTYFTPKKRGPKELLTTREKEDVANTISIYRRTAKQVTTATWIGAARAALAESRPHMRGTELAKLVHVLSKSWAAVAMRRAGLRVRAATTDRTVQAGLIVQEGRAFYKNLKGLAKDNAVDPRLTLNMDEFFVELEDGNGNWTWERLQVGEKANIAVKQSKAGFTCSVLHNMDGELLLVQMIWKGKTEASQAPGTGHPKIMQQHREDSHFQSKETMGPWLERCVHIVKLLRLKHNLPHDAKGVLLLDAAPQHGVDMQILGLNNILLVGIPKKMTHVFQPSDMYVIRNMKLWTKQAWEDMHEEVYVRHGIGKREDAVAEITSTSLKILKGRKLQFFVSAVKRFETPAGVQTIKASWDASGIPREVFGIPCQPGRDVVFDQYVAAAPEEMVQPPIDDGTVEGEGDLPEQVYSRKREREPEEHIRPPVPIDVNVAVAAPPPPARRVGRPSKQETISRRVVLPGERTISSFFTKKEAEKNEDAVQSQVVAAAELPAVEEAECDE